MSETTGLDVEALAGVLGAHRAWTNAADGCMGCDWVPDNPDYARLKHDAHVAAAVAAHLAPTLRAVVGEMHRAHAQVERVEALRDRCEREGLWLTKTYPGGGVCGENATVTLDKALCGPESAARGEVAPE